MIARVAAENAEFMLEGHDVELAGVQEVGRAHVVLDIVVLDLKTNDRADSRRHDPDLSSPRY